MKNHENKDESCSTEKSSNHHANASAISPQVEALRGNEHANKDKSKLHDSPNQDKRAAARQVHTNGSTPKDDQ